MSFLKSDLSLLSLVWESSSLRVLSINNFWRVKMTTKITAKTWQETLASIKPQVRVIPKVKVMRKKSWRRDDFTYEVEFVKPTWESLSSRDRVQFIDCFVRGV